MDMYFVFENDGYSWSQLLGTQSFRFFYPCSGFYMLVDMSQTHPELIKFVKVITEQGIQYTVEDFLRLFEGEEALEIRKKT